MIIISGDYFDDFMKREVKSGRYNLVSEVIRSVLRLLEDEEKKEKELIKALEKGEIVDFYNDLTRKKP